MKHVIYKNLFIPQTEVAEIKCAAITEISQDCMHSVPNAYIEAVLSYLDKRGLLSLTNLDVDSANRRANVAQHLLKKP